jgi:hypothetical protein
MPSKVVLFGASDRHNFGDLLFPHIVSKHLPNRAVEIAGLADRDLRPWGGHLVKSLASIKLDENATLIHCGGELLTCTAYEAAVMLQTPEHAQQAIAEYDADPAAAAKWAAAELRTDRRIPYVVLSHAGRAIFNAIGGVEWHRLGQDQQEEAIAALKKADWISVRDRITQAHLQAAGVTVSLCPDPAVMVKEYFDGTIQQYRQQGEVAEMVRTFPRGFIACQFSAEFGDDETLDRISGNLLKVCSETGFGVVLFRAGAAPWHDRFEPYERLSARMPAGSVRIFQSLHLWDICALIAASRAFCGSSLHGSIVAMAYGLPHVSLRAPQHINQPGKVAAYLETWEPEGLSCCVTVNAFARMLHDVLARSNEALLKTAEHLTGLYRQNQQQWMSMPG